MKFQKGEYFADFTNSAAATASFAMSAATRNLLLQSVSVVSDLSGAIIKIQGSGTTLWQMQIGSSMVPAHFNGLTIDGGTAQSLSANLTASSIGGYIAVCGMARKL